MAIRDAERCAELAKLASFVALHIVSSILCPSIVATQRGNFRKLACELYDPTAWQISAGLRAHGRDANTFTESHNARSKHTASS